LILFELKPKQKFVIYLLTHESLSDPKRYLLQFKSLKFADLIQTWKSLWLKENITNSTLRAHIDKYISYAFVQSLSKSSICYAISSLCHFVVFSRFANPLWDFPASISLQTIYFLMLVK